MSVHARRAKKERILKLEEEAKTLPEGQGQQLDPDGIDTIF